jgi:hypothetical protein
VEARRAHNPDVVGSKPTGAIFFSRLTTPFFAGGRWGLTFQVPAFPPYILQLVTQNKTVHTPTPRMHAE